ncbi:MAG: hypothetical protein ACFFFT_16100 [Candidatus Thorarchaeota archaeon]
MKKFCYSVDYESVPKVIELSIPHDGVLLKAKVEKLTNKNFILTMKEPYPGFEYLYSMNLLILGLCYSQISLVINSRPTDHFYKVAHDLMKQLYEKGKYFFLNKDKVICEYKILKKKLAGLEAEAEAAYPLKEFQKRKRGFKNMFKAHKISQRDYQKRLKEEREKREKIEFEKSEKEWALREHAFDEKLNIEDVEQLMNVRVH